MDHFTETICRRHKLFYLLKVTVIVTGHHIFIQALSWLMKVNLQFFFGDARLHSNIMSFFSTKRIIKLVVDIAVFLTAQNTHVTLETKMLNVVLIIFIFSGM